MRVVHRDALASALEFVEHSVIRTRVGAAGCRQVRTRGVVAAAFDHWDSRAGDPNLHTHVVVANKVQCPDGAWRSVDGRTIHAATVTVSELYDALLADEVASRLGATWSLRDRGERRNPAFEVDGVGENLLAEFSTRAEQVHCAEQRWAEQFAQKRGRARSRTETTRARQHLTRETRPPKVVRALGDLLAVQMILGHATATMTMDLYGHLFSRRRGWRWSGCRCSPIRRLHLDAIRVRRRSEPRGRVLAGPVSSRSLRRARRTWERRPARAPQGHRPP